MTTNFKMTEGYREVIKSIQTNKVTTVMGSGGTGKSTLIKYIMSKLHNVILLAPTGISALNINGVTIHSYFKFPPKYIFDEDIDNITGSKYKLLLATNFIIIDEISMVSSNLLDSVDKSLRKSLRSDEPFGGIPILLVGDCFQLPPIIKDYHFYSQFYDSEMFFDADVFKKCLAENKMGIVNLTEVHRQKNSLFIQILNNIRVNKNVTKTLEVFNSKVNISSEIPKGYIQITPYNAVSDETNRTQLELLEGEHKTYFGATSGKFKESNIPVPKTLRLKVGAQVMLCRNNSEIDKVNGSVGIVTKLEKYSVWVKFDIDNIEYEIKTVSWEEYGYVLNPETNKYESSVVGKYKQIPLKLAWSMSIHKSQSTSIEKLYIDMDKGAFIHGMLYVALSRSTDLSKLYVSKPILESDVIIDENVIEFYKNKCLQK